MVLFSVIGSSIAVGHAGFSEENKSTPIYLDNKFISKDVTNQTKFSPKIGLAPENPKFTEYKNKKPIYKNIKSSSGHKGGFSPSPVDLSHLKHPSVEDLYAKSSTFLPTSYDLRTLNRVTPVEDQGQAGVCWTFATYGSLESYLMPKKAGAFQKII